MGLNESGELFCAFYDWTQAQPQNTSPWKGETWSWLVGTGKRKLFCTVLKHSLLKVNPPFSLMASKLSRVLERRPSSVSALSFSRHPDYKGTPHRRLDEDAARRSGCLSRVPEQADCERTVPTSFASFPCSAQQVSSHTPDADAPEGPDYHVPSSWHYHGEQAEMRRASSSIEGTLGCAMSFGSSDPNARIEDNSSGTQ